MGRDSEKEKNIRLAAADLLLGRGVRFRLAGAPFLWRVFGLDRITVRALKLGAIIEIARIIVDAQLDENATRRHLLEQMNSICLCVAIAMLNNRRRIKRRAHRLAGMLQHRLPAATLLNVFYYIQNVDRMLDFTNITGYLTAQAAMLKPRPGHAAKGS